MPVARARSMVRWHRSAISIAGMPRDVWYATYLVSRIGWPAVASIVNTDLAMSSPTEVSTW